MILYKPVKDFKDHYNFVVNDMKKTNKNLQLSFVDKENEVSTVLSMETTNLTTQNPQDQDKDLVGMKLLDFNASNTVSVYGKKYIQTETLILEDKEGHKVVMLHKKDGDQE